MLKKVRVLVMVLMCMFMVGAVASAQSVAVSHEGYNKVLQNKDLNWKLSNCRFTYKAVFDRSGTLYWDITSPNVEYNIGVFVYPDEVKIKYSENEQVWPKRQNRDLIYQEPNRGQVITLDFTESEGLTIYVDGQVIKNYGHLVYPYNYVQMMSNHMVYRNLDFFRNTVDFTYL